MPAGQRHPRTADTILALGLLHSERALLPAEVAVARANGILVLVADRVPRECRAAYRREVLFGELRRRDLRDVASVLHSAGIPFLCLKGQLLSQLVYGDPVSRGSVDIDIAVVPGCWQETLAALDAAGHQHKRRRYSDRNVEAFRCRRHGTLLEVHFTFSTAVRFGGLFEDLWRDPMRVVMDGEMFLVPKKEVLLVFLLVHFARHLESQRAIWVEDILRFVGLFGTELQWELFLDVIARNRLANATWVAQTALDAVLSIHGLSLGFPSGVAERIAGMRSLHGRAMCSFLVPRLLRGDGTPMLRRLYYLGISESWRDRAELTGQFLLRKMPALELGA